MSFALNYPSIHQQTDFFVSNEMSEVPGQCSLESCVRSACRKLIQLLQFHHQTYKFAIHDVLRAPIQNMETGRPDPPTNVQCSQGESGIERGDVATTSPAIQRS